MRGPAVFGHEKRVERVALPGGVDLGVENREIAPVEVAADAREQIFLVPHVDQHFGAGALLRQPRTHDRPVGVDMGEQGACMPGNILGRVAQEINHVQLRPERLVRLFRERVQAHDAQGLLLAILELGVGRNDLAAEQPRGRAIEVLEEFAFPRVPDLGTRAANIGHSKQIQRNQAPAVCDQLGKSFDHRRIGDVLLLRHLRHGQVLLDQKHDQLRVLVVERMIAAEAAGVARAEQAVITVAPLGDVVIQRRDLQQPGAIEVGDQLAAQRVFVRKLGGGKTAQVAHHHQDVLVDRIDVKQVVLHLADDAPERGQIVAEHRPLVHAPQFMRHPHRLLQQLEEGCPVDGIAPEVAINQPARMPDRAQQAR